MILTVEEVMGAAEIGTLLGVSRQRVQQLVARADFPKPAKTLAMGKIWLAADVERWVRDHRATLVEPTEGTPRRRVARRKRPEGPDVQPDPSA